MRLTRRDALYALVTGGALGTGTAVYAKARQGESAGNAGDDEFTEAQRRTAVAVAEVVFPSAVSGTGPFVEAYLNGLSTGRTSRMRPVIDRFNASVRSHFGTPFAELSRRERDVALREIGVDRVGPDPDGTLPELVRYYLVNQLLYGLFTTPQGSQLFGVGNPVGFPGGYESYQRAPDD